MRNEVCAVLCVGVAYVGLATLTGCSRAKSASMEAAGDPASSSVAPVAPEPAPITLPAGTRIRVRLLSALDTERNRAGDQFTASLDEPLVVGDRVVVPRGTTFYGHVTESKPSGRFKGRAVLALKLDSFDLDGQTDEVSSTTASRASRGHKKHELLWIGGGSGGGAMIGAIAGGGAGALIGGAAGAAAGTVGSAITGKREIRLPVETTVTFTLESPVALKG